MSNDETRQDAWTAYAASNAPFTRSGAFDFAWNAALASVPAPTSSSSETGGKVEVPTDTKELIAELLHEASEDRRIARQMNKPEKLIHRAEVSERAAAALAVLAPSRSDYSDKED